MKKYFKLLFAALMISSLASYSQDIIRTKSDTIRAKVVEIGIDEIKYKDYNNLEGPVIVIAKNHVYEITYENGIKFLVSPDPYDASPAVNVRKKTHAIKFEFFSPLTNKIAFAYETMLKVGTNLEFKAGVIGPGTGQNSQNASGLFIKAGVKFLTSPTYVRNGVKYAHGLKGFYIKPELIYNTYTKDEYINYYIYPYTLQTQKVRYTNGAVNIVFGMQHILGNIVTLDYYLGTGYGYHTSNINLQNVYEDIDQAGYAYTHLYLGNNFPLIISGGMTIGVLF